MSTAADHRVTHMNSDEIDHIRELLNPSLGRLGVDLVSLTWHGRGRQGTLRVVIDKPGGVDLEDCERVSLAASAVLDAHDPIAGRYLLEVSSPGAERPLSKLEDYLAALGRRVNVRYRSGMGEAVVEGRLLSASDRLLELETRVSRNRTRMAQVAMGDVLGARIVVDI